MKASFCKNSTRYCDGCMQSIAQTGGGLVQALEEVKALAALWTPLVSTCSLKTHKRAEWHSKHWCIWAWNTDHAINSWTAGSFSEMHLSTNKESSEYKETPANVSITFNLVTSQCIHPKYMKAKVRLLWDFPAGSVAVWCWFPLELGCPSGWSSRQRDLSTTADL